MSQYYSLLFPEKCSHFEIMQPVFFGDLQLEGILKAIVTKYMDFDIKKYFYTLPHKKETIRFRQNVYRDMEKNNHLIIGLKKYTNLILEAEKSYKYFLQVEDDIKKGSYLLLTCHRYLTALDLLRELLGKGDISSEGLNGLKEILEEKFADPGFISFSQNVGNAFTSMKKLQLTLLVKNYEISVLEDEPDASSRNEYSLEKQLQKLLCLMDVPEIAEDRFDMEVTHLFPAPLETSPLENTVIDILRRSRPEVFSVLKKFATYDFTMEQDIFVNLKNEIIFYISFLEFEKQLSQVGYKLTFPQISDNGGMEIEGVYDVALAWKNRFSDYEIVSNDISYGDGRSFLVITGPNQGGKTTCARALGQSVYFMMMGLKAPCSRMTTRYFERIMTHFEVEESVETGAGKLKEELIRLKPMMQTYSDHSFIILNELFTTATTFDARIMAQKVMEHFIRHDCMGVYVTHIQELADEESVDGIQSMVAQVDPCDASVRTFKIIPMAAAGLGYSDSIVKKYDLDFESVSRRISSL